MRDGMLEVTMLLAIACFLRPAASLGKDIVQAVILPVMRLSA